MADAVQTTALLVEDFDAEQITAVRHAVSRGAAGAGMHGRRLEDFVLAVNEIVTNAVRHAGGRGSLRMWIVDGVLVCEVTDKGGGIPAERINGQDLPPSHAVSGRGLWLARHLVDEVELRTSAGGTIVVLRSAAGG
ncbi:ATP-binding protein [Dactylosporangium roseum]|uniref:ATP-binding protein n=1 Tax=Dactylosporangium roseum TaxID=47989 RepID=A0ABY5Z1C9_9ACTN|nr:ATP-binding protein [Dactylosporangium roseum]UWZ34860.1 ATP-binding protein [Dactylosporangium roseum]